jgi:hypothetical protein
MCVYLVPRYLNLVGEMPGKFSYRAFDNADSTVEMR